MEAPDWNSEPECGGGLHGLLWGEGGLYCSMANDAIWLVVKVDKEKVVSLIDKVKFPSGFVVFAGTREGALQIIQKNAPSGSRINYSTLTAGDGSTLTAGDGSTLTAGDGSTLTAGDGSTLTAGDGSTLTAGNGSTLTAGDGAFIQAGIGSKFNAGINSVIRMYYRDEVGDIKFSVGIVAEYGPIRPNTWYRLNSLGEFVEIIESEAGNE